MPPQEPPPEKPLLLGRVCVAFAVYGALALALVDGPQRIDVGLVAVGAAVVGSMGARFLARRLGPRNLLRVALLGWFVGMVLLAVEGVLGLPGEIVYVYAVWVGSLFGAIVVLDEAFVRALPARAGHQAVPVLCGLGLGAVVWILLPSTWGLLLSAALALAAWALFRRTKDPLHPDDPLRRYAPWGDGSGLPVRTGFRRLLAAPATILYLVVSWALFMPFAEVRDGILQLPFAMTERFAYNIPDLSSDPLAILTSLLTAQFVNHDVVQLVYVSALLVSFGLVFEAREGTKRFLIAFFGVGTVAGIVAGLLLHLVYPHLSTAPVFEAAWERTWSGGSAGAFAVMGAIAARARTPWPLLGFFVFWEINVGWWYLRSYTPAFHLSALFLAFLLVRHLLPPHRERTTATG